MNLQDKKYFYFTQNSLSTFESCPYRFEKKYMENIKWDRERDKEVKGKIDFGTDFHKIAQRYFMRIPIFEEGFRDNKELYEAYINLKERFPLQDENLYYPEYTIRYNDDFVRLEANIDLIIVTQNGTVEIIDWKTNAKLSNADKYLNSLQTKIYMMALKKCMKEIFGIDVEADKISMTYFSPERAEKIVSLIYSQEKFEKDEKEVKNLIEKVYNFNYNIFEREKYAKQCKFCEFNLFCENQKCDEKVEFALDWDKIDVFN